MLKREERLQPALLILFLAGMLLWSILLPDRARSDVENRTLQQFPRFSWSAVLDGSFMQETEDYLADQFPLRDAWTGLKARTEQLAGKREFHGVYLCGDTLISKVEPPDESLVKKNLSAVAALADKTEAQVYLGLIPSAAEIWSNRLPEGAESWTQSTLLEQAETAGVPLVDFQGVLETHKAEELFYRTDHHWTTLGAYYGYTAVMDALGRGDNTLPLEDFPAETVSSDFCGTLYSVSGIHWLTPDSIVFRGSEDGLRVTSWRSGTPEQSTLYDRSYLAKKDQYSAFLGGNQPLCVIQNENAPDGGKLLLVRDSYSDSLTPFLSRSFSEVHLLDLRYYRTSVAQYVAEHEIDTVIVLYSIPNFIEERNLAPLGM
jgi:hypothetical protein